MIPGWLFPPHKIPSDIVALHLLSAKSRKHAAVSLQYVIANGHAGSQ